MKAPWHQRLFAVVGLIWILAVMTSYYAHNTAYYREKVSVFTRFLVSSQ